MDTANLVFGISLSGYGYACATFGTNNYDISENSLIFGINNRIETYSPNSSILGGSDNLIHSDRSSGLTIVGGNKNEIYYAKNSSIIGGSNNLISASTLNTAILGGTGHTIYSNAQNSVILGGHDLVAISSDTAYMSYAYVDNFVDYNPLTTLPPAKIGRTFFSGSPLFRLMCFTGNTSADVIIL